MIDKLKDILNKDKKTSNLILIVILLSILFPPFLVLSKIWILYYLANKKNNVIINII
mgnify:CR=1 FL=1